MYNVRQLIRTIPNRTRHLSPEWFFLLLGGVVSISLVFIVPPFQAPDEHSHFMRAVQMSYGKLRAEKFSDRQVGELLPARYELTFQHYLPLLADHTLKAHPATVRHDITDPITTPTKIKTLFENTAVYPPLAYVPQAVGVTLARVVRAPVILQLYAARLASAVSWLAVMFLAIRLLPFGKWAGVALALTPLSYLLAASSSNDAIIFSTCILWIALMLKLHVSKDPIDRRLLIATAVLAVVLGLCKQPYSLLVLLVFMIPARHFANKRQYLLYCAGCLGGALLVALAWMLAVKGSFIPTNPAADPGQQLRFLLANPLRGLAILSNNLFLAPSPASDFVIYDFTGLANWVGIRVPALFVAADFLVIALLMLVLSPKEIPNTLDSRTRWLLGLLAVAGSYAVALLIYLSFEAVQTHHMVGLNSRYFIPFVFLLIPIVQPLELKPPRQYFKLLGICQVALVCVAIMTIVVFVGRFYSV